MFYFAGLRWYNSSLSSQISEWQQKVGSGIVPLITKDGLYSQYPIEGSPDDDGKSLAQKYYKGNLERLSFVKSLYDPTGLFAYKSAIPYLACSRPSTAYRYSSRAATAGFLLVVLAAALVFLGGLSVFGIRFIGNVKQDHETYQASAGESKKEK